jgi:dTDP-4-amino-4,6-dideoxygalactose transaminase
MNNIEGALGYGNILNIKERLAKRRTNAARYLAELQMDGITLLKPNYECEPSYWIFTLMVENRRVFMEKLKSAGIASSVLDRRIDKNPIFHMENLPNQEKFDMLQTSIPVHDDMTEEDVDHVISTIRSGW